MPENPNLQLPDTYAMNIQETKFRIHDKDNVKEI